ncbi:hypothetical protein KQX54_003402 [Cotesia glomerata]|uniref:Peptidase S1 domain-containing protein n=1 Tax=Cotesia glomerata TaxID=32391 RepID=A0AAV7IG36_COTGL|nr:hypothetical protein KQX54_003402 [Cotesia glomerata]
MIVLTILILVLQLSTIFGSQSTIQRPDERTFKGWALEVRMNRNIARCDGLFIGPRVFLTSSLFVQEVSKEYSLFVVKIGKKSWRSQRDIPVSGKYFDLGLKDRLDTTDRKFAVLKTDEPVIPSLEVNKDSFVKIAEDISEVNLGKCSMLVANESDAYFQNCNVKNVDGLRNSKDEIECSISSLDQIIQATSLFCALKNDLDKKVLVGFNTFEFTPYSDLAVNYKKFANLAGLKVAVI